MTGRQLTATDEHAGTAVQRSRRPQPLARDAVGCALVGAGAAWTLVAAGGWTDGAWPLVALYGASALAYGTGRALGRLALALTPALVLAMSLWVGWLSVTDWMRDGRMEQPFGYPNAQAGFFVLSVSASLMLAVLSRRPLPRAVAFALAAGFAGVVLVSGSLTAIVLLLLPAAAILVRTERSVRRFVGGGAALVVIALVGAVVLGALSTPAGSGDGSDGLASVLTERRLALWSDALALMQDSPLKGVGPGRFGSESPIARSDPDARWAHNEFLQVGAETGVVGLLLLVAVFLWGFWALAVRSGGGTTVALGAAALAAVGIHASVDYVLRFPALPLVTAALLGAAIATAKATSDGRRHSGAPTKAMSDRGRHATA